MVTGGKLSYLNIARTLALSLLILLPFQNCGQDLSADKQNTFTGDNYDSSDCLSDVVDCGPRDEFLQISLDMNNPENFAGLLETAVFGRCNVGNYPHHVIYWELRNPDGSVARSESITGDNVSVGCIDGQYRFMLKNLSALTSGVLYSVFVKIIGVASDGQRYQNVQANGTAEIEFSR